MKTILILLMCVCAYKATCQSEGVAINTDGSVADNSAILDLKSSTGGVLIPRMTSTNRNAISNPATGLLVFQTDIDSGFFYYNGSGWIALASESSAWSIKGNSGTTNGTSFIGTVDGQDFDIRTNNIIRTRFTQKGQIETLNTGQSLFIGQEAGESDDLSNNFNVFMGMRAGYSNTIGSYNVANGYRALYSNIDGYRNSAFGAQTLYYNTSGYYNTAIGYRALYNNATGYLNTASGGQSLFLNVSGYQNTAMGYRTLYFNTEGYQNSVNGYQAMYRNTLGFRNSAIGYQGLRNNTEGFGNVANGFRGLYNNATGNYNTGVGYSANSVGSAFTNSTGIGYNADNTASNSVKLGNDNVTSIGGQVGWTTLSDARFKKNIRDDEVKGLEFITGLNPVTYNYDVHAKERWKKEQYGEIDSSEWAGKYKIEEIRFSGFLAQEVAVFSKSIGYAFSGVDIPENSKDIYGLRYADFVVPIVKSVQELNEIIETQNKEINTLKRLNQSLNNEVVKNAKEIEGIKKHLNREPK